MPDADYYQKFLIKDFRYWGIYLHTDQYYLGRCYIWFKGNTLDFFDISKEELEEFFSITKKLKKVLSKAFQPDMFNYAILGNATAHLHVQVIPRYKTPREAFGIKFSDENFGKALIQTAKIKIDKIKNENFNVPEETLIKIKDLVKEKFESEPQNL